jgi:hypothetical protein
VAIVAVAASSGPNVRLFIATGGATFKADVLATATGSEEESVASLSDDVIADGEASCARADSVGLENCPGN